MEPVSRSRGLAHRVDDLSVGGALWVGAVTSTFVLMVMITLLARFGGPAGAALDWQSGTGTVGADGVSLTVDGTDLGATGQVPLWFDAIGARHYQSWPACLSSAGAAVTVRFATVPVAVGVTRGQSGIQPIVAVDCRQP
ncbi:hypothetical protein BA895_17750 [Humibacillus sp. DSM 29435]|uniref:hypothetical protein n=1 Tax=Humibacillus sp. DSM 29435 TaxID=1869167 RepID=UPI000872A8F2|nr:hypothetical protein [Humibacillus sp. DSM 29435]OFE17029.1 hypothetical protein BA895_17750 [Humibacillus sp. DSM 29435]